MSLDEILGNPERLAKMVQAVKNINLGDDDVPAQSENDSKSDESTDKIAEKLPEIMSVMKMLGGTGGEKHGGSKRENDRRICLLVALKPYLSPHRCEIIDYIIKMNNIGEIFKNIM